jgi:hypothetical protein
MKEPQNYDPRQRGLPLIEDPSVPLEVFPALDYPLQAIASAVRSLIPGDGTRRRLWSVQVRQRVEGRINNDGRGGKSLKPVFGQLSWSLTFLRIGSSLN